ncbi:MAG: hypothetical protein N2C14_07735 [Planctomycetales bacterium]
MTKLSVMLSLIVVPALGSVASAELKSGPQPGQRVGRYSTTKCNAAEDGVRAGKSLCYT